MAGFLMIYLACIKNCWRSPGLLLAVCASCVFLLGAGAAPQADKSGDTHERFIELDGEIQAIKEEILGINGEILQLEELLLYPHGQQLVVLVSVANNSPVSPDSIALQLDGQTLGQHTYTGSEDAALQEGGIHRLYTGRLGDGKHSLEVSVTGKLAGGKAFHRQRSVTITKLPGPKYLELHLGPGENSPEPALTIREWQQ
jgi:hypothetical protein